MPVTRVLSGIQPTGNLHLGNLLGAILRWVRMQDEAPCLFFLADLHSLSDHIPADTRRAAGPQHGGGLIASGIDPAKAVLFAQSDVPAHAELCWLLNGTARMGWLRRMTQWKDKSGKNKEGASVALFDYPVLQAADILLYQASHVPVGEDQKQHIELTRDIANKFNLDTGTETFVVPEPFIGGGVAARVMSLRDGSAKMSKSDPSDMSRINLIDSDDEIAAKIRKARTDPEPLPGDPDLLKDRPEARNLVGIMAAITGESEDGHPRPLRRPGLRRIQAGAGRRAGRRPRPDPRPLRSAAGRSCRTRPPARPGRRQGDRTGRADLACGEARAWAGALRQPRFTAPPAPFIDGSSHLAL